MQCKPLFQYYKVLGLAFSEAQGQPYSRIPIPHSVYSFALVSLTEAAFFFLSNLQQSALLGHNFRSSSS